MNTRSSVTDIGAKMPESDQAHREKQVNDRIRQNTCEHKYFVMNQRSVLMQGEEKFVQTLDCVSCHKYETTTSTKPLCQVCEIEMVVQNVVEIHGITKNVFDVGGMSGRPKYYVCPQCHELDVYRSVKK